MFSFAFPFRAPDSRVVLVDGLPVTSETDFTEIIGPSSRPEVSVHLQYLGLTESQMHELIPPSGAGLDGLILRVSPTVIGPLALGLLAMVSRPGRRETWVLTEAPVAVESGGTYSVLAKIKPWTRI